MGRHRSVRRRYAAIAVAVLVVACSRTTDSGETTRPGGDDTMPVADAGATIRSLAVSLESTRLEPGQSTDVIIQVTPAGVYPVQLALIEGALDAYLDDPALSTNARGVAKTRLSVVARTSNRLVLQAHAAGRRTTVKVALADKSTAELSVVPLYAGSRSFEAWEVLWGPNLSCEIAYSDPAWDVARSVLRQPSSEGVTPEYLFTDVPSSEPLTLLVKARRFAVGCVGAVNLSPQSPNRVEIPINQRFADVSQLDFPIEMNIAPESEFWSTLLTAKDSTPYIASLASKFRGSASSDVSALLDVMGDLSPNPTLFRDARDNGGWDALLTTNLSPGGAQNGLSSRVQRWLQDGARLLQTPHAFVADLKYHADRSRGEVSLLSVAGKAPEECAMPVSHVASVTVDAQDVLRVGLTLRFTPSVLFTCLANTAVTKGSDAGVSDVLSALAADFDCGLVAQWLSNANGALFEGCDTACGRALCTSGLSGLWERVVLGDDTLSSLEINAAGKAHLSDDALVSGVDASWVGRTLLGDVETSVAGSLRSCSLDPSCQSTLPL